MGRRKDQFCWDNAKIVEGASKPMWKCNHCEVEYQGSAQRIRNHLAGEGNDIRPCPVVNPNVREIARMKRADLLNTGGREPAQSRRQMAEPAAVPVQASSSLVNVGERREPNGNDGANPAANPADHNLAADLYNLSGDPSICKINMPGETSGIGNNTIPSLVAPTYTVHPANCNLQSPAADFFDLSREPLYCNISETSAIANNPTTSLAAPAADYSVNYSTNMPGETSGIANNTSASMAFAAAPIDLDYDLWVLPSLQRVPFQVSSVPNVFDDGCELLMESILNKNIPIETVMDPCFKGVLESLVSCGPSAANMFDSERTLKERLRLKFEAVVTRYTKKVASSGKTMGCTCIHYNLSVVSQIGSRDDQLVTGIYSPKGFYFTEGSGPVTDKIQYINHPIAKTTSECHYQTWEVTQSNKFDQSGWCVQDRIRRFYKDICKEVWVHTLVKRSKILYKYMMLLSQSPVRKSIRKKLQTIGDGTDASPVTRLIAIMDLKYELEDWEQQIPEHERVAILESGIDIIPIIKDATFWCDGLELKGALTPLTEVYKFVDTLDPTAGKMHAEIKKANHVLKSCYEKANLKYKRIWICFQDCFGDLTSRVTEHVASFLSPAYISTKAGENLNLSDGGKDALKRIVGIEECNALDAELEDYSIKSTNPLANISSSESAADPVQLWENYGGNKFPLLKKCTVNLLNQPMSCMCNQVKKHMLKIQGTDNLLLRLNYKMMKEFENKKGAFDG